MSAQQSKPSSPSPGATPPIPPKTPSGTGAVGPGSSSSGAASAGTASSSAASTTTGTAGAPAPPKTSASATSKAAKPGAQPSPDQLKKARELWYRGVDAFRNARYEDAREAFAECYALMPKSDVLRNLSISEIQSGHYVSAARHLTQLLAVPGELPPSVREEATHRLSQAEAQVGKLNVSVDVPGAAVTVDGASIGQTPLEGPWYVEPGQHEVSISKAGYPVETRQVYALAGVGIPVSVSLETLRREQAGNAKAAALMGTREGETPRDRGLGTASAVTLIASGTVAAIGLAGGIYFTVSANGHDSNANAITKHLDATNACNGTSAFGPDCEKMWREQTDAHNDRQRALVSFVGFGVASAFTLGYALWLVFESDDEAKPAASNFEPSLAGLARRGLPGGFVPEFAVGPGFAGLNLHSKF